MGKASRGAGWGLVPVFYFLFFWKERERESCDVMSSPLAAVIQARSCIQITFLQTLIGIKGVNSPLGRDASLYSSLYGFDGIK